MADDEHLRKALAGAHGRTEIWNAWKARHPGVIIDLTKANLGLGKLAGADFRSVDLTDANLSSADLVGANFSAANLSNVDLRGADMTGAILRGATLKNAELSATLLPGADLTGAILQRAVISSVNLAGADLTDTNLKVANLSMSNLTAANLTRANLVGTNLFMTILKQAQFNEAKFGLTLFSYTMLEGAKNLDLCVHVNPSSLDHQTLMRARSLPLSFLRGCGLPDDYIKYLSSFFSATPVEFFSCFISYSHEDKRFAHRLYDALQRRGIRCWLDDHQLLPGDSIFDAVDRGIRFWDKTLLCCSEFSLNSWWVDNEIQTALKKEQALHQDRREKVLALVPLNLDGYLFSGGWQSGMSTQVQNRLAANFTGWENDSAKFDTQFERVVKALRADKAAREEPPPQIL